MRANTQELPQAVHALRRIYESPTLKSPHQRGRRIELSMRLGGDVVAVAVSLIAATLSRFGAGGLLSTGAYGVWLPVWGTAWIAALALAGLYDVKRTDDAIEEFKRIVNAMFVATAAVVTVAFGAGFPLSRLWLGVAALLSLVTLVADRVLLRRAVRALRRRGKLTRRALVVGAGPGAAELADAVAAASGEGMEVVGLVFADERGPTSSGTWPALGTLDHIRELVVLHQISEVLVAPGAASAQRIDHIVAELDGIACELRVAPGLESFFPSRCTIRPLAGRPMVGVERVELQPYARVVKRSLDVAISLAGLIVAAPVLLACAIAIRFETRGPVFFRQQRVGAGGREFLLWKLRSMVVGAHAQKAALAELNEAPGLLFKVKDDPRVTRVGRVLRRLSLDEIPQLINVLKGDMSLVGPRPPLPEEVEAYDARLVRRLLVKPGITGLWQVSGRNDLTFEEYVRFDILYVQNWSIALDLFIMLKTIPAVVLSRGAY